MSKNNRRWQVPTADQFWVSAVVYSIILSIPYALIPILQEIVEPGTTLFFVVLLVPSAIAAFLYPVFQVKEARTIGSGISFVIFVMVMFPILLTLVVAIVDMMQK